MGERDYAGMAMRALGMDAIMDARSVETAIAKAFRDGLEFGHDGPGIVLTRDEAITAACAITELHGDFRDEDEDDLEDRLAAWLANTEHH